MYTIICLDCLLSVCSYHCAVLYRHDWSRACSSVDLETEPCGHQSGNGQPMAHSKVNDSLWIVALCQGDVGKPGGLVDGRSSTHLINLHQEPRLEFWFLPQYKQKIISKKKHNSSTSFVIYTYTAGLNGLLGRTDTDMLQLLSPGPTASFSPHHPVPPQWEHSLSLLSYTAQFLKSAPAVRLGWPHCWQELVLPCWR